MNTTEKRRYYRAYASDQVYTWTISFRNDNKELAWAHARHCADAPLDKSTPKGLVVYEVKFIGTDVPNVGDFGEWQRWRSNRFELPR